MNNNNLNKSIEEKAYDLTWEAFENLSEDYIVGTDYPDYDAFLDSYNEILEKLKKEA